MAIQITDTAIENLTGAAQEVQAALFDREGEVYAIGDIQEVLEHWLEGAIEQLAEDACTFCVTGDRGYASFNRDEFKRLLAKKPSRNWAEEKAQAAQDLRDQFAAGLDRVA